MKNIFIIRSTIFFLAVAIFGLSSCKKSENIPMATSGTAATLSVSNSSPILQKIHGADTVVALTWGAANFGYKAAVSQTLEFGVTGTNFSNPINVQLSPNIYKQSYTAQDFNQMLLKLNLPFTSQSSVDVRIISSISSSLSPVYSNVVTLKVTPYPLISWVYVPGAYQGWNPASADSLISATGNGVYIGTIYYTPNNYEFKITPAKTWDLAYGDGGNSKLSTSGGNLVAPGAGSYQITADLNALTYNIVYNQWSLIGDATTGGWSTDTDMKYNNGDSTWNVTTTLISGGLKFRKNHDWGTNYGGNSSTGGALVSGGSNISITTPGTYSIILNIPANTYTITKQ